MRPYVLWIFVAALTTSCGSFDKPPVSAGLTAPDETPPLPPLCGNREMRGRSMVVFSASYCSACRLLLDDLERERSLLEAHNIEVVVYSLDAPHCTAAQDHVPTNRWSVGWGSREALIQWGAQAVPTTYMLVENRLHTQVRGYRAVEDLVKTTFVDL